MVDSPNFARLVHTSALTGDGLAALVRRELLADFREHNLTVEERAGGGLGSDDASFSQKGIPTIALYTGAYGPKSEIEANLFGGAAGRPYDPCYHRACDTIENINLTFWNRPPAHLCVRSRPRRGPPRAPVGKSATPRQRSSFVIAARNSVVRH
jgi:hypothetical protein